ncbi:MAG TPA: urease [Microscillaceae bacterium]|nr:urease [Microscillaceae bacterium]
MRNHFFLGLFLAFLILGSCKKQEVNAQQNTNATANLVFINGSIYGHPTAEAIVVNQGKIEFIGSNIEAQKLIGSNTQTIDLKGKMLLPGFIDNHVHAGEGGEVSCLPSNALNIDQQKETLKKCAADVEEGKWVIGYGMHLDQVLGNGTTLNKPIQSLDKIFPKHPVIIMEQTSHAMFVNTLALNKAGIHKDMPDPQGGKFMKDENGELNGVLIDNAGDLVMEMAVNSLANKFSILVEGIKFGLQELKKNGITTIGDGRTYWRRGMLDAWKTVAKDGLLTARVSIRPWIYPTIDKTEQLTFLQGAFQNDIQQLLIVNQVKMYIDGVPENGTARLIQPYTQTYFQDTPYGINYISQNRMVSWLTDLYGIGYGAHVHALGDKGIREVLDAVQVVRSQGSQLKYHITHVAMLDKADLSRFAQLNVDADIQVGNTPLTQQERSQDFVPFIGASRASELLYSPVKSLKATGANVTLSSDWTVYPLSPLNGISVSVQEGAFTIQEAIDAYTINAAKALGLDSLTGSITVGKSADFVVLEKDLTKISANEIKTTRIMMTVLQGKVVYEVK